MTTVKLDIAVDELRALDVLLLDGESIVVEHADAYAISNLFIGWRVTPKGDEQPFTLDRYERVKVLRANVCDWSNATMTCDAAATHALSTRDLWEPYHFGTMIYCDEHVESVRSSDELDCTFAIVSDDACEVVVR